MTWTVRAASVRAAVLASVVAIGAPGGALIGASVGASVVWAQDAIPAAAPEGTPPGLGAGGGLDGNSLDPEIQSLIEEAEQTRPVPTQLLNDLATGNGDANAMINEFLASGNPEPRTVAVRAIALSLAVGRDPRLKDSDRRFALNQSINDGMSASLGAPRIMNVEVDADFVPAEGTFAWDLGGLTTPVADGFQQLTPFSAEVGGFGMRDRDRVGDGNVLEDVIENLESVNLKVPNGQYRVTLLTAEQLASRTTSPFGEKFKVNGVEYFLGKSNVGDWFDTAYLRGAGDAVLDNVSYGAAGLSVLVEVGNGTLTLEFEGARAGTAGGGLGSIISGIVMEPVELPSRLDLSNVRGQRRNQSVQGAQQGQQQGARSQQARPAALPLPTQASLDSLLELEFRTQAAIATVSGIAPAAGPGAGTGAIAGTPTTRPPAAPPPPPVFVSNNGVSPSS